MTPFPRPQAPLAAAMLLALSGCGYVGEPLPPLMNIPGHGENITALQRASSLFVHVTLPIYTTEGLVLKQAVRLDLRIGPKPSGGFDANAWAATAKAAPKPAVAKGVAEFQIPAADWIGKEVAIAVKVVGANNRDAGWSAPTYLQVVPPPAQPHDLAAAAAPQGVKLTWQGAGNNFIVLRRGPDEKDYSAVGRATSDEYVDATAQFGKTYTYLVQSTAKAGDGEAQSDLSTEAAVTPLDTFPTDPPAGLTAVPSTASVELVWERSPNPAVTAYRVYRALGAGQFDLLADSQPLPTYSDHKIDSGKTYRYTVTAVKANKVESKPSDPVEVTAP